jgi:uncharacterized protein (TIGR02301 family)
MIRLLAVCLICCFALGAAAQTKQDQKKPAAPPAVPIGPPVAPPPPYEPDLQKLVETLGAISYLATVCPGEGVEPAAQWRAKAQALIDAEAPDGARRERLLGLYNRGFSGYALAHRQCNDSARLVITRLLGEAAVLSRIIGSRFGG